MHADKIYTFNGYINEILARAHGPAVIRGVKALIAFTKFHQINRNLPPKHTHPLKLFSRKIYSPVQSTGRATVVSLWALSEFLIIVNFGLFWLFALLIGIFETLQISKFSTLYLPHSQRVDLKTHKRLPKLKRMVRGGLTRKHDGKKVNFLLSDGRLNVITLKDFNCSREG